MVRYSQYWACYPTCFLFRGSKRCLSSPQLPYGGQLDILNHTVDGQNPAPPRMMILSQYLGRILTIPGGCLGCCPSTVSNHWIPQPRLAKENAKDAMPTNTPLAIICLTHPGVSNFDTHHIHLGKAKTAMYIHHSKI